MSTITSKIAKIARNAGYEIKHDNLITLKKDYATRTLQSPYCDQYEAFLGEALGMIRMNKKQLEEFVAVN